MLEMSIPLSINLLILLQEALSLIPVKKRNGKSNKKGFSFESCSKNYKENIKVSFI